MSVSGPSSHWDRRQHLYSQRGECNVGGPVWWSYVSWAGLFFNVCLGAALLTRKAKLSLLLAFAGLTTNLSFLGQHYRYGITCWLCLTHLGLLAVLFAVLFGGVRPSWRRWTVMEKCAAVLVPCAVLLLGWSPTHAVQLSRVLHLRNWTAPRIELPINAAKDVLDVPTSFRKFFSPPVVLAFLGDCTRCRATILRSAETKRIPLIAVFHATQREIRQKYASESFRSIVFIADPQDSFSHAMNAPPIRIFAIGQDYSIAWAQPKHLLGFSWIGDVIPFAARKLPLKGAKTQ